MQASLKRWLRSPLVIAIAALVLRLAILYVTWHRAAPAAFNDPYGFEMGRVADSIASGGGFSSPLLLVKTGPTAYLCPIYPYVLAGIFKVWGIYSFKSHVIAQGLNCLFSALVVLPIFAIAKRSFDTTTAVLASWLWVVLPNAWHIPIAYIWETSLTALWFALLFWVTLTLREKGGPCRWAGYGALWAIGALISATVLSVMPFFFLWLIWEARKQSRPWLRPVLTAVLILLVGIAPWTIRNYLVFGKFIPLRSNLGLMLWHGNNSREVGVDSFAISAVWDQAEADTFKRMGEIAYMQMEQRRALNFMRSHPGETLWNITERIFNNWFGVTDRPNDHLPKDPLYIKALFLFNALFILFGWLGALVAWRLRNPYAPPYLVVLLVFPAVYYLTVTLVRYRFPIDPILTILAIYGLTCASTAAFSRRSQRRRPNALIQAPQ